MIDNNEERAASANSGERGPPPRQKQFQERGWILSRSYLQPGYPLNDSDNKSISAADLPAVLRAVEDNEREQPSAKEIILQLCNIG